MCGRYTRTYSWKEVHDFLDLRLPPGEGSQLGISYNVAPTQDSPIARVEGDGTMHLRIARWGFIPHWAESAAVGNRMINARSEEVASKPAFRAAFKSRRCLIPVSGFYEWRPNPDGRTKQPWRFSPADASIMCLGGLWERWERGERPLESFAILTRDADDQVRPVHDRMPVILQREHFERWLDPCAPSEELMAMLATVAPQRLDVQPVSERFNNPRYPGP